MTLDLFDPPGPLPAGPEPRDGWGRAPGGEPRTLTVSALNAFARELLESTLPPVLVSGEVSGWKRHTSGHCYFSLKDSRAQLRCVMWRSDAQRLPADPEDGMEVRALGSVTLYERRGDFQLVVRALDGLREGGLWRLAFERLKAKLAAEGLLAAERKRALPRHPRAVGVITSPVGAALHDILHVIERRAPWTRVVFCPARVQGDGAGDDVARAIGLFARAACVDVLIVGRGGGSIEDLWGFNQEVVARAIAACPIPVISAVGHETDTTIADLVADARAPTPSAAAERAVPDGRDLLGRLEQLRSRLEQGTVRRAAARRATLEGLAEALRSSTGEAVRLRRARLGLAAGRLEALSPLATLRRGYAVPLAADGRVLRGAAEFTAGERLRLRVVDGSVGCTVDEVEADGKEEGNA